MPWRVALAATLLATGAVAVADLPVHANIGPIEHRRTSNQCPLYPQKRTWITRDWKFCWIVTGANRPGRTSST